MEFISAIGMPFLSSDISSLKEKLKSLRLSLRNSIFSSLRRQTTEEMTCERTVAAAAPHTPVFRMNIKKLSSRIFTIVDIIIAISGVLLSPSALSIPEHIL